MMTDQSAVHPEKKKQIKRPSKWTALGIFFSAFSIILAIAAFGYAYFHFAHVDIGLAQMVTSLNARSELAEDQIKNLQNEVNELKKTNQESAPFAKDHQTLMNELHSIDQGSIDKWYLLEAHFYVKLASHYLLLSHNAFMAMALLHQAAQILEPVTDSNIQTIKQSLHSYISSLAAQPQIDPDKIYMSLTALEQQINQMPLMSFQKVESGDGKPIDTSHMPWWEAGLHRAWLGLQRIVIVKKYSKDAMPVATPEEKFYLYQNLQSQIDQAKWGLLHRKQIIYETSLQKTQNWIKQYFDQQAEVTKTVLQTINDLMTIKVSPSVLDLSPLLQLFEQYAAQPNPVKPA